MGFGFLSFFTLQLSSEYMLLPDKVSATIFKDESFQNSECRNISEDSEDDLTIDEVRVIVHISLFCLFQLSISEQIFSPFFVSPTLGS